MARRTTRKKRTTRRREPSLVAMTLRMAGRTYYVTTNAADVASLTTAITHAERLDYEVLEARLVDAAPPGYRYVYDLEDWDY